MMPNITRGGRIHGLLAYLAGPGRENVHDPARLVAGDDGVMLWHGDGDLDREAAHHVASMVDHPHQAFATRVTSAVKRRDSDGLLVMERAAVRQVKDADVWHCSLSLRESEGVLSDEKWAEVSEQFVAKMGFLGGAEEAACRWIAVRHGLSKAGNDHVHVVVSLVREDGTKANTWHDRSRAQQAAGELELEHGLQVLESRGAGRGDRGLIPAELGVAERREAAAARTEGRPARPRPQTDREQLVRVVRACAAATGDEAEFVRRVVRAGVRIRPRFAKDTTDVVAGYSVALRTSKGVAPDWYGGGRLARDLTLPRLRAEWPDTPQAASAAVAEWTAAAKQRHPVSPGRETREVAPELWEQCETEVRALRERLRSVASDDRATWAHVAHETAGAFAAWSLRTEPTPGPLAATAESLARSAQLRARDARPIRAPFPSARGAALVLASIGRGGHGPVAESALLVQLANVARALYDAHQAAGDAQRAAQIAATVNEQLRQVQARVGAAVAGPIAASDEQAAEALRLARRGLGAPDVGGPASPTTPRVRPPREQPERENPER